MRDTRQPMMAFSSDVKMASLLSFDSPHKVGPLRGLTDATRAETCLVETYIVLAAQGEQRTSVMKYDQEFLSDNYPDSSSLKNDFVLSTQAKAIKTQQP